MLVLHDPDTLLHETVELLGSKVIPALESADRIRAIVEALSISQHHTEVISSPSKGSTGLKDLLDTINSTHNTAYLEHLENVFAQWREANLINEDESVLPECFAFASKAHPDEAKLKPPKDIYARPGFFAFDMSSGMMKDSYRAILASANLAAQAVQRLVRDRAGTVLALCRPPGHHCDGRRAGGYCYINNCAVAVSAWRRLHGSNESRVAILDVDFHHGNGTQDIFYSDPGVFYTSIHGEDEFPYYTGAADERGTGDGYGMTLNLPLAKGSSFGGYQARLSKAVQAIADFSPELLCISLGFDTFRLDPLGHFDIDTEDYETMARAIRRGLSGASFATVILLEGGYNIEHLGGNLLSFLKGWENES